MEVEVIGGVKTVFHSGKEGTLQKIANLLFKFYCEIEIKRRKQEMEVSDHGEGVQL